MTGKYELGALMVEADPASRGATEYSDGTPHCHWYRNRFLNRLKKVAWEPARTANKKGPAGLEKTPMDPNYDVKAAS